MEMQPIIVHNLMYKIIYWKTSKFSLEGDELYSTNLYLLIWRIIIPSYAESKKSSLHTEGIIYSYLLIVFYNYEYYVITIRVKIIKT